MAENWLRTDETEDVAGSIRHVIRTAPSLREDPQAWKWVALALHSALQGACVCHLTTSAAPLGAVTKRNAAEWLDYFEDRNTNSRPKPPKTDLMNFPDLIKAIRKPNSAGDRSNVAGIAISDSELTLLSRFHAEIRNQFVHFEPMGWSIELSGLPKITILIARIIGEMLHLGYAFRHQDAASREEMKKSLQTLSQIDWTA